MLFGATISITCRRDSSSDKFCSPKVVFQSDVISEDDLDNSKMDDLDYSTSDLDNFHEDDDLDESLEDNDRP